MEGGPSLLIRASDDQRSLSLRQDGGRSEGGSMVAIRLDTREVVAIRGNVLDAGQLAGDTEMSDAPCLFVEREQLRAALLGLAEDCLAATNESDGSSDWKQLDEVIHLYARMISDEDHRGQRRRLLQDARLAPSSREALERVSWMGGAP